MKVIMNLIFLFGIGFAAYLAVKVKPKPCQLTVTSQAERDVCNSYNRGKWSLNSTHCDWKCK